MTTQSEKIINLNQLAEIIKTLKVRGNKVVQCHGVFDLVHPGHIRHLAAAKKEGDLLVVTITSDRFVNKGPGRPIFNQSLRAEFLASIQTVDFVAVNDSPTAVEAIRLIKPNVYVKGSDYSDKDKDITGKIYDEEEAVKANGGEIVFTNDVTFSSSNLINSHFSLFPAEVESWIKEFRSKRSIEQVVSAIDSVRPLRALVVGEAIIDEYVFCDGLGKSSKDPILAFKYRSIERQGGGSLAVANHLAGFCQQVGIVSYLGESERHEEFISSALLPGIKKHFVTRSNAPTIHKRRFVDTHTLAKMLELYVMEDNPPDEADENNLLQLLDDIVADYDVVVVTDYGHGMMTTKVISLLNKKAKFLAVNTQANAGNRGFNTVSKYPRADYVCLAGHEVALEARMRHAPFKELTQEISRRIKCDNFTVTLGRTGSLHYSTESGFVEVPAFATQIADRVGAGDAVLAITSLLVAKGVNWDIVGFSGNIAGAMMVADLGNRVTINRPAMIKHITALMK